MAGVDDVFFDEDVGVAEGFEGFALGGGEGFVEGGCVVDYAHAFAAAAVHGFDEDGETCA